MVLKITRISNKQIGNGFESKLSLEYFDVGFRDYTDIVMEIWKIYLYRYFQYDICRS